MKKILIVAPFKDMSGFASAGRHLLHALQQNKDIEVVARAVTYDQLDVGQKFNVPSWLQEALTKDIQNIDCCIQVLTSNVEAQPIPGVFNILYTFLESDRLNGLWASKAQEFDMIMVPCKYNAETMLRSGISKPVIICPPPCDIDIYLKERQPYEIKNSNGRTIFYNICQLSGKKGIDVLLRSYFAAFAGCPDEVLLVLKTYINMQNRANDMQQVKNFIQQIKNGCRIPVPKLSPVLPIVHTVSEDEIHALHKAGHAYVNASRAEGWCALPGTFVDTTDGPIKIENLSLNNSVISHYGVEKSISNLLKRLYAGKIISIRPHGNDEFLSFTEDHQHYIVPRKEKFLSKEVLEPKFISAKEIKKGDLWVVPKIDKDLYKHNDYINISDFIDVKVDNGYITCPHSFSNKNQNSITKISKAIGCSFQYVSEVLNGRAGQSSKAIVGKRILDFCQKNHIQAAKNIRIPNTIRLTPEFMFFIGHYIAEGFSENESRVVLATHKNEQYGRKISREAIFNAFGLDSIEYESSENGVHVEFYNNIVGKFLRKLCGHFSENKFINNIFKGNKYVNYLLQGVFYGDGSFKNNSYSLTTTSRRLARDLIEVFNINNIFITSRLDKRKRNEKHNDCFDLHCICQHNDRFYNLIRPVKYNKIQKYKLFDGQIFLREDDNNFYLPIMKIECHEYLGEVYNLSVHDHESYTCNGYATHNCVPAFDALGHGNVVISHDKTGMEGYIRKEHALLYNASPSLFFDVRHPDPSLFTGVEQCFDPSPAELAFVMQKYHLLRKRGDVLDPEWAAVLQRQQNAKKVAESFDYRVSSNKIWKPILIAYDSWKLTGEVKFENNTH